MNPALDNDVLAAALSNRTFVYRYAWRLLAAEPDEQLLELIAGDVVRDQVEVLLGGDARGTAAQARLAQLATGPGAVGCERLRAEYTRLFVGPGKPTAPLWESVYRDPDELLFQQSTLDVRQAYSRAGYRAEALRREADDHLAIELDFMASLSASAADAVEAGDLAGAARALRHSAAFLKNHLNMWLGDLNERLTRNIAESVSDFYVYAIALVTDVCKTDVAVLDELVQMIGSNEATGPEGEEGLGRADNE